MTTTTETTSVSTAVDVNAPIERAFQVFTVEIGTWWDDDKHILDVPLAEMVFEPHVGGNIIDRGTDGSECRWARVLAYDPPRRVCFSWDINTRWEIETDPAKSSEIEITFTQMTPGRTHVVLTHRHLDRHGDGWQRMREAVSSGWSLTRFADIAEQTHSNRYVLGQTLPTVSDETRRARLAATLSRSSAVGIHSGSCTRSLVT